MARKRPHVGNRFTMMHWLPKEECQSRLDILPPPLTYKQAVGAFKDGMLWLNSCVHWQLLAPAKGGAFIPVEEEKR